MDIFDKIDLTSANRQLDKALNTISDQVSTRVSQKMTQNYKANLIKIKSEMLGLFQVTAYQTFQEVFYREYGDNYDVNRLNLSLHFTIDDSLHPHLSYDVQDFSLKDILALDKKTFNQNARIDGDYSNLLEFDELDAMEEMDFYGLSFADDNPYDYATEEMTPPEDYKVFRPRKLVSNPKEVYEKAEAATLANFATQYEKKLKPLFIKKYGIQL